MYSLPKIKYNRLSNSTGLISYGKGLIRVFNILAFYKRKTTVSRSHW